MSADSKKQTSNSAESDNHMEENELRAPYEQKEKIEYPSVDDGQQHNQDTNQSHETRQENLVTHDDQDDDEENLIPIPNPTSCIYNSYDEAENALHVFSRREGFEVILGGGIEKNKHDVVYKKRMICAKGAKRALGKSRETHSSVRPKRASKITGCKWAISIVASNIAEPNQGKWFLRLGKTPTHNHGAVHASSLANHRRRARSDEVQSFLKSSITSGIDPKRARALAYEQFAKNSDGDNLFTLRDIYNEYVRLKKE